MSKRLSGRRTLLQSVYHWLTHVESADTDAVRRGQLLNVLIAGTTLLTLLFLLFPLLQGALREVAITLAALVLVGGALQLSRSGHPTGGAYLYLGTLWGSLTLIMLSQGTITKAFVFIPYLFVIPIIVAGLTAGPRAPFLFAGLTLAVFALVWRLLPYGATTFTLSATGQLLPVVPTAWYVALGDLGVYLFLMAFLSFMFERSVATALTATRHQATDVAEARADATQRSREAHLAATVRVQAAELVGTAQTQSSALVQQEVTLQEVSVTIEELAATAREMARSAAEVSTIVAGVLTSVEQGQTSLDATSAGVAALSAQGVVNGERMEVAADQVGQIGQVADVLSDIADSIHLLALNAAIEAAGAGAYGARFGVVAREVQELADRARQASELVQGQVTVIQAVTASALAGTRAGQQAATTALAQMTQTRQAHQRIHERAGQASALAGQIAQGTDQQQMASAQVLLTIRTFVDSVGNLAQGSTRVAAAAARLSRLATELDTGRQAAGPLPESLPQVADVHLRLPSASAESGS